MLLGIEITSPKKYRIQIKNLIRSNNSYPLHLNEYPGYLDYMLLFPFEDARVC